MEEGTLQEAIDRADKLFERNVLSSKDQKQFVKDIALIKAALTLALIEKQATKKYYEEKNSVDFNRPLGFL